MSDFKIDNLIIKNLPSDVTIETKLQRLGIIGVCKGREELFTVYMRDAAGTITFKTPDSVVVTGTLKIHTYRFYNFELRDSTLLNIKHEMDLAGSTATTSSTIIALDESQVETDTIQRYSSINIYAYDKSRLDLSVYIQYSTAILNVFAYDNSFVDSRCMAEYLFFDNSSGDIGHAKANAILYDNSDVDVIKLKSLKLYNKSRVTLIGSLNEVEAYDNSFVKAERSNKIKIFDNATYEAATGSTIIKNNEVETLV